MGRCKRVFVLGAGVLNPLYPGDISPIQALRLSVQHYVENITDAQLEKGIMDIPEGDGDLYLLPALVEKGK